MFGVVYSEKDNYVYNYRFAIQNSTSHVFTMVNKMEMNSTTPQAIASIRSKGTGKIALISNEFIEIYSKDFKVSHAKVEVPLEMKGKPILEIVVQPMSLLIV